MPYVDNKPRIWIRLRVVGFEGFAIRFPRPLYLQCGVNALGGPPQWHFTTEPMRAWQGTERDARPLIRTAAESSDWDFDLAMEVEGELVR